MLVLAAVAVIRVLPGAAVRLRSAILAGSGLCGALFVLGLSPWLLLLLGATIAWISCAIRMARDNPRRRTGAYALLAIAPALLLWLAGKHAMAADLPIIKLLYFVGFSYFLVKAWTLITDCLDGRTANYDPVVGAAFFLHLPTYPIGPMHYYSEFEQSIRRPLPLTGEALVDAVFRLLWGMVKVTVLAPLFTPLSLLALQDTPQPALLPLVIGAVGYSIVLYLDFSGFVDMAIATSRLLGIEVPENFRNPYFARNIRDFWQRWHISFTRALTSCIFVPLTRALQKRLPHSPRTVMVVGYLVTFGAAGYWHGPTPNFVLWGLYHAAGLIAYDYYRSWQLKRRLARGSLNAGRPATFASRAAAIAATFIFVSIGWILFVLPVGALMSVRASG
jgi:D-alanyl-lipoteichoic acid acyltransferase DltB (MBOAT superfamily)